MTPTQLGATRNAAARRKFDGARGGSQPLLINARVGIAPPAASSPSPSFSHAASHAAFANSDATLAKPLREILVSAENPQPTLRRLERVARLLDSAIRIPGTRFRIGVDGLLGLIPGVGDVAGLGLSAYIVVAAARAGASTKTLIRMLANIGVEGIVGLVPVLGDAFDIAWKANERNVALLRADILAGASGEPSRTGGGWLIAGGAILFIGLLAGIMLGTLYGFCRLVAGS